jgi:O-antigen ligase
MEVVVLALAVLSPWAFGGVDPVFELALTVGIVLVLLLWAAIAVAAGRFTINRCPVTLVLSLIFLAGLAQLVPLPSVLLRVVSPGAAEIRDRIYPEQPEQLTKDTRAADKPAWPTVSVYPHATRGELFRWFAILILFAAVRNHVASTESLQRLSLVMVINGCLLAVIGIAQTLRAKHEIYWTFWTSSDAFGPFVNRNHFAAYLNLCIALGIGILVRLGPTDQDRKQKYMVKPNAPEQQKEVFNVLLTPFVVLHSPAQLWTLVGIGLMVAALMCSLSRGGFATLFIALVATMCLRLSWPPRFRRLEVLLVPLVLVLGLFAWIGFRPLETRLGALFRGGESVAESRWSLWTDLLHLSPRFWLLGSGYGTLGYVEPLGRQPNTFNTPAMFVEHAHNDYLEALIEGGVIRAGLTLLLVGLIFAAGFRGLRRYGTRTPGALAVGAMTGFLAIALHSAVDFSLTTPAVAILAAVVVAQLIALDRPDPTKRPSADYTHTNLALLGSAGRVGVALAALVLGGIMILHAWQADRVYRLKLAAYLAAHKAEPADLEGARRFLDAAAAIAPDDADLQTELGQEHLDIGREERDHALARLQSLSSDKRTELFLFHTVPALEHFALARRHCPLLPRPQMRFASHATELTRADPPSKYWDRALWLAPFDPDLWYYAGQQRLKDNQPDLAWQDWRRSLALFPAKPSHDQQKQLQQHLRVMVAAAAKQFGPNPRQVAEQLMAHILPDRPDDLTTAAGLLDPTLSPAGPARPLLARALELLSRRPELSPDQYYLKARVAQALDEPDIAIKSYGQAVAFAQTPITWRIEYAKLLKEQRRWKDAQRELLILRQKLPESQEVKDWLEEVDRQRKLEAGP